MPTTISRVSKTLAAVLLLGCLVVGAWFAYYRSRAPRTQTELLNRMVELGKKGRYDKAAQLAQNWMNNSGRDSSHDGFLYQQIALMYIGQAYSDRSEKTDAVAAAAANLEKALAFFDRSAPEELSLDLYTIGRGYEALGDISDEVRCRYYGEAQQLFVRQLPLIKGDSYTAYGTTAPLEPVRAEIRKRLDEVNDKRLKANCQHQ